MCLLYLNAVFFQGQGCVGADWGGKFYHFLSPIAILTNRKLTKISHKISILNHFRGGINIDVKHRFHGGWAVLDREFMGSTLKLNVS